MYTPTRLYLHTSSSWPKDVEEVVADFAEEHWFPLHDHSSDELFYHYTDSAGLYGIIDSSELRFTDVVFLNDAQELKYGINLIVVVYPWPDQIINRDLNSRQVSFWQAWAKGRNVQFVNLFPAFISDKDGEATIREYFIPGDVHWNESGHRLVAEKFLRFYEMRPHEGS